MILRKFPCRKDLLRTCSSKVVHKSRVTRSTEYLEWFRKCSTTRIYPVRQCAAIKRQITSTFPAVISLCILVRISKYYFDYSRFVGWLASRSFLPRFETPNPIKSPQVRSLNNERSLTNCFECGLCYVWRWTFQKIRRTIFETHVCGNWKSWTEQ